MKKKLVIISFISLLVVCLPAAVGKGQAVNSIFIPSRVRVKTMQIKLDNIAHIEGSKAFVREAKKITLGQSPLPGYRRVLYRQMIVSALQQKNINLTRVRLNIPYRFIVRSNYKKLAKERLIKAGKTYIDNHLSYPSDQIKVTSVSSPQQLKCPQGNIEFKVTDKRRNLLGRTMLPVEILVDGKMYQQVYLEYKVELYGQVMVAKQALDRGQFVSQDLFKVKQRAITNNRSRFVQPGTSLDGKKLTQAVQPGDILFKRMLEMPPLVKRWQEITLIARVNGVEVVTTAKALEPGHKGQIIQVQNLSSGETIKAKVIAKGKVEITIN